MTQKYICTGYKTQLALISEKSRMAHTKSLQAVKDSLIFQTCKKCFNHDIYFINLNLISLFDQKQFLDMNPTQLIENRSTLLIFRDCLKLAQRMMGDSVKTQAVRGLIKRQFAKNRDIIDQQQIRLLKLSAARAISNYIIFTVKEQYKLEKPKNIYEKDQREQQQQIEEDKNSTEHRVDYERF